MNDQDPAIAEREALRAELRRLRDYVASAVPFLEEAWAACFHGQKQALLSAEERGMGRLLTHFREIRDGHTVAPEGYVTLAEASKMSEAVAVWAHRLLGSPNELRPELRDYVQLGETCAHGLERAHAKIGKLQAELDGTAYNVEEHARCVVRLRETYNLAKEARDVMDQCGQCSFHFAHADGQPADLWRVKFDRLAAP